MDLDEFYDALTVVPADAVIIVATGKYAGLTLDSPHSWRGDYEQISFDPHNNKVTAGEMLSQLDEIYGTYLEGWKGGEYYVGGDEELYVAVEGEANNDAISKIELVGNVVLVHLYDEDE